MNHELDGLHEALLDLTGLFNHPQADALLLKRAGVTLDRALFPLLSRVGARGPITIDALAQIAGRDQSTVSRQITKLERLGLVTRHIDPTDGRRREVMPTEQGRRLLTAIDRARRELLSTVFRDWTGDEQRQLVESLRHFVASVRSSFSELADDPS